MTVYPTARRLSPAEKLSLASEIFAAYGRVRWWMWRRTFPDAIRALRGGESPADALAGAKVEVATEPGTTAAHREGGAADDRLASARLGHAVRRALSPLPGDSRCLMRSLVLTEMLSRRGIRSSLVIGVAPGAEFAAHAWVEHDGVPVTDDGEVFTPLIEV